MLDDDTDRTATSLRGRLADVYFAALLSGADDALRIRLGERATIYHPLFGAAAGLAEIQPHLTAVAAWLGEVSASYAPARTLVGIERDVSEGTLTLRSPARGGQESRHLVLPVAVVMERRKNREVDLRVYHAVRPFDCWQAPRAPRQAAEKEGSLPTDAAQVLGAIRLGDPAAVAAQIESNGHVQDGAGVQHDRSAPAEGGDRIPSRLHAYFVQLLQNAHGGNDWVPIVRAWADDGRTCSIEYETEKLRGEEQSPKEGLLVLERGDSGLFHSVRIYDEVGFGD